jgi:hypothetical protein
MLMGHYAYPCDFCACSPNVAGNDIMGVEMQSSVGVSALYRSMDFKDTTNAIVNNKMLMTFIQAAYAPKNWVDIKVNIPFVLMMNRFDDNGIKNEHKFSIGDVQLLSNFTVWQRMANDSMPAAHKLNVGGGLELPTGKQYNTANDILQNINFGSQSVDFMFNILYFLEIKNWGMVQTGQVKINTYNADKFKYGNNYGYQFLVNYKAFVGKSNLIPALGSRIDVATKNLHNTIIQNKSGYYMWSLYAGAEWMKNNYHLGMTLQQPLMQNTSQKLIQQKTLVNLYFKYQIKRNKK